MTDRSVAEWTPEKANEFSPAIPMDLSRVYQEVVTAHVPALGKHVDFLVRAGRATAPLDNLFILDALPNVSSSHNILEALAGAGRLILNCGVIIPEDGRELFVIPAEYRLGVPFNRALGRTVIDPPQNVDPIRLQPVPLAE